MHQFTKHKNYKDFNLNSFSKKFNNNKILDQSSLEDAVQVFNEEMEKTIDIIVPLEEKKRNRRDKTNHGILVNYLNKEKLSETGKEHTSHIERITTRKHLPGNKKDTIEWLTTKNITW